MKKAQISMFVIVGAIILVAALLIFFLARGKTDIDPKPDITLETRPAVELVEVCLSSSAERAIRLVGENGGTLNPPPVRYPPYRSESVLLGPTSIPYWRHLTDCSNPSGCEELYQPPLCKPGNKYCFGTKEGENSIQESMEQYIEATIEDCINDFRQLGDQYDIVSTGEPDVSVVFSEGSTQFTLNYPIIIESLATSDTIEYENYLVSLDVDLLNMYRFAEEIIDFARETNYYETQTMNLVTIYSGLESELPPTDQIQFFSSNYGPWIQSDVKDILENDLLPLMGIVRFINTKNFRPLGENSDMGVYEQYADGIYRTMTPKTSDNIYPFNVYHHYLYEPIFLQIGEGKEVIQGKTLTEPENPILQMAGLFFKDYRFDYYISYPLVVSINDDKALNGDGYDFQFAIEVNVRNNVPGYQNFTHVDLPGNRLLGLGDFRLPQVMTIKTEDRLTGEPLDDVTISYVCGNEYALGVTRLNGNNEAVLETTLPYCEFGGYLRYQKLGYLGEAIQHNHLDETPETTFTFKLWPVKEKEIIIRKRSFSNITAIENAGAQAMYLYESAYSVLEESDLVLLNVERKPNTPYDTSVPMVGFLKAETSSTSVKYSIEQSILDGYEQGLYTEEEKNILLADISLMDDEVTEPAEKYYMEFVPGTFTLDATLLDKDGLYVPADVMEVDSDLITEIIMGDQDVDLPEQNFSTWVMGGMNYEMTISPAQLYRDDPIIIYVLEMNKPENWADLLSIMSLEEFIARYGYLAIPIY